MKLHLTTFLTRSVRELPESPIMLCVQPPQASAEVSERRYRKAALALLMSDGARTALQRKAV